MEQRILRLLEVAREKDMELRALRIGIRAYLEDLAKFKYGGVKGQIIQFEGDLYELAFTKAEQIVSAYDGESFLFEDENQGQASASSNQIWMLSILFPLTSSGKLKQDAKTAALRLELPSYANSYLRSPIGQNEKGYKAIRHSSSYLFTLADGTKQVSEPYRSSRGIDRIL